MTLVTDDFLDDMAMHVQRSIDKHMAVVFSVSDAGGLLAAARRAAQWRELYADAAGSWADLLDRLDLAEDATVDDVLREARGRLNAFVQWAAQLDDPANPEHRTVTLVQIAERAQEATVAAPDTVDNPPAND